MSGEDEAAQAWRQLATLSDDPDWFDLALKPLADAALNSPLLPLRPFTSLNNLCFAEPSKQPFWTNALPALIRLSRDSQYTVIPSGPYDDDAIQQSEENWFETAVPQEAIRRTALILSESAN